ncbi:MAG: ABC transporter permease subunit [Gammaproteobacteria bacterium]|nr:ABC transporter permease subunit [Gammaproteobacteria bacterium]MDE0365266.1 ABC transporter permease subunit [Gammaproteobacteria bacterium]
MRTDRHRLFDTLTRRLVALGGWSVLAAIALIFFFLVWVVAPIFAPVSVERLSGVDTQRGDLLAVSTDDTFAVASLITRGGELVFLDMASARGAPPDTPRHSLAEAPVKAVKPVYPSANTVALLTADNRIHFYRIVHEPRFNENSRFVTSRVDALFDATPLHLDSYVDNEVAAHDVFREGSRMQVAILDETGATVLLEFPHADDARPLRDARIERLEPAGDAADVMFGPGGRWLYRFSGNGAYRLTDIARPGVPVEQGAGQLVGAAGQLTALEMLLGRYSVLVADERGVVTQWSLRRAGSMTDLAPVRQFRFPSPIDAMQAEPRRKGFVAFARNRQAHLVHTTSHRVLESFRFESGPAPPLAAFSPAADRLVLAGPGRLASYAIHNNHPEISWSTLWRRVFYEGYDEPVHTWQSSSADTDFEPKFSLTPLLFGTLKAAFYAMLFAMPLAVMGAVYTACFMNPGMRRLIRPGIETMAGLPTVVLGFLAGLWLAPLVENMLGAVILCLAALPMSVLACAFAWQWLPGRVRARLEGWLALVTVPVLAATAWLVFSFDAELEAVLFGGDARAWMYNALGLGYDQRNALVVGIAMGLAVIPVIFSVAEQAIADVPAHLVQGSLALGASRWQTVSRIVMLTAAPGIFSAVMIGLGRVVGETMIVLMASGNTPILDLNVFQGMRTFAANIVVELPTTEVASSHYRLLFLIALLLFVMTFAFNTAAEVVRERLRDRYARL